MANGYLHGVFESIPGNETNAPTPSTKLIYVPLIDFSPELKPDHLDRDDELRNVDEPLAKEVEDYEPGWSLESRAYPDLLGFLFKAMLGAPVTTAGDGIITDPDTTTIPAGCTRHVWTAPYGPSGLNPQSTQWQAAYKDQAFFLKLKGAGCSQLGIESPEKGGVRIKAAGPNLYTTKIADPALTPTYEALTVACFKRGNLTLPTWLAGTGETADFNVNIANPMEAVSTLGIASLFPDSLEKGDGPILMSGSIPKRVIDPDDWDALVAATAFTIKARWKGTVTIASGYKYSLWIEANNAQYTDGGPEGLANKRRLGASFDWEARYGGTPGSSKITLVNNTTSYV